MEVRETFLTGIKQSDPSIVRHAGVGDDERDRVFVEELEARARIGEQHAPSLPCRGRSEAIGHVFFPSSTMRMFLFAHEIPSAP